MPGKSIAKRGNRYSDAEKELFKQAGWDVYAGHYTDEAYVEDARTGTAAYIENPRKLNWQIVPGVEEAEAPIAQAYLCITVAEAIVEVKENFEKLPAKADVCWLEDVEEED